MEVADAAEAAEGQKLGKKRRNRKRLFEESLDAIVLGK